MPLYALAALPLIMSLPNSVLKAWYADNASVSGGIDKLYKSLDLLLTICPQHGYYVNPSKTWLITKPSHYERAKLKFGDNNIHITIEDRPYFGNSAGLSNIGAEVYHQQNRDVV